MYPAKPGRPLNMPNRNPGVILYGSLVAAAATVVLRFLRMSNTLTIRLPDDLAEWLSDASRKSGIPRGRIVRAELEKARHSSKRPFLRLAGAVDGPPGLSMRKGFSRK